MGAADLRFAEYRLDIEFQKGSEAPSRVFRTLSNLIEACAEFDRTLVQSLDLELEPISLLEDVEAGSIRVWLANVLRAVPDDGLKDASWQKSLGHYLLRGKWMLINWAEGRTQVSSRSDFILLQKELRRLASESRTGLMPVEPVPIPKLIGHIEGFSKALAPLLPEDRAVYHAEKQEAVFNASFNVVPESMEDLIVERRLSNVLQAIIVVKKPDYLGFSKWDFKYDDRIISATITDSDWLKRFQSRAIDVRPGDALEVLLSVETAYGFDREVVRTRYTIEKVERVLAPANEANDLFE